MLVNLVKRTSGDITIDGLSLDDNATKMYERVGFAMQEVGLDETATAREMLSSMVGSTTRQSGSRSRSPSS